MKSMKAVSNLTKYSPGGELESDSVEITEAQQHGATSASSDNDSKDAEKTRRNTQLRKELLQSLTDPPDGIIGVCSSKSLESDTFNKNSNGHQSPFTFKVPSCAAADYVTLPNREVPLSELMANYYQNAIVSGSGLGLNKKTMQAASASKTGTVIGVPKCRRKPKTLSEKRQFLQQDIMRYGVDAAEKMYPRQQYQPRKYNQKSLSNPPIKGIKMKPKPIGIPDFEEIDARKILKPNSHDKYIRDPLFDSVVYIERRGKRSDMNNSTAGGLVPLSTLVSPNSTTVLPSNCRLLTSRNKVMGKPKLFVKDKDGRLLAVGGSRYKYRHKRNDDDDALRILESKWADKPLRVYTCPQPPVANQFGWNESQQLNELSVSIPKKSNAFIPFEMDAEYASIAASAVSNIKPNKENSSDEESEESTSYYRAHKGKKKLDIRAIKRHERQRKLANHSLKDVLEKEKKTISVHIQEKLDAVRDALLKDIDITDDEMVCDGIGNADKLNECRNKADSDETIQNQDKVVLHISESKDKKIEQRKLVNFDMDIENKHDGSSDQNININIEANQRRRTSETQVQLDMITNNGGLLNELDITQEDSMDILKSNAPQQEYEVLGEKQDVVYKDQKKEAEEEMAKIPNKENVDNTGAKGNQMKGTLEEIAVADMLDAEKSDSKENKGFLSKNPVHNSWSDNKNNNVVMPDSQYEKPVFTSEFKARMNTVKELRQGPCESLAGWQECDVDDCFCKDADASNNANGSEFPVALSTYNCSTSVSTRANTGTVSPAEYSFEDQVRGRAFPLPTEEDLSATTDLSSLKSESNNTLLSASSTTTTEQIHKKKVAKNLQKVRRALKTLGVNLYEMDDKTTDDKNNGINKLTCDKDSCRLGCICESIMSKPVAPTHCGKVECMFRCCCSEEALKIAAAAALSPTGSRRSVGWSGACDSSSRGISAEGCAAKLTRSSSSSMHRRLAAEEQKFNHSVVAATGGTSTASYLMLGATIGRQRRERKVPTRYQDSEAFSADWGSGISVGDSRGVTGGGILGGELDHDFDDFGCGVDGPGSAMGGGAKTRAEDISVKRMTIDNLRNDTIARCTVLLPMVKLPTDIDTRVWCMYHCQYRCPCSDFKNALDYGPDLSRSRNVSKRTGATKFVTKKQKIVDRYGFLSRNGKENATEISSKPPIEERKSNRKRNIDAHSPSKEIDSKIYGGQSEKHYENPRKIKIQKVNGKYITSSGLTSSSTKVDSLSCLSKSTSNLEKSQLVEVHLLEGSANEVGQSHGEIENHSARTSGKVVRSNKTRMPHKIVVKKIRKYSASLQNGRNSPLDFNHLAEGLVQCGIKSDSSKTVVAKHRLNLLAKVPVSYSDVPKDHKYSSKDNIKSQKQDEDEVLVNKLRLQIQNNKLQTSRLNLGPKPKNEKQFATWGLIRDLLQKQRIKLWFFYRSAIPVLFIALAKETPYEPRAFDIQIMAFHNQQKGLPSDMPPMVRALIMNKLNQEDLDKYAILTYNGHAWEITGVMEKRVSSSAQKDKLSTNAANSPKYNNSIEQNDQDYGQESFGPLFEQKGNIQPFRHQSKLTPPPPLRRKTSNIDPNPLVAVVQPQPQRTICTKLLPNPHPNTAPIQQPMNVPMCSSALRSTTLLPKPGEPQSGVEEQYEAQNKLIDVVDSSPCIVNVESEVEKLPSGKNLVTMVRGVSDMQNVAVSGSLQQQPTMQIKLPPTAPNQHWSIIRVDGNQGSVQCPDSSLALKVNVLKQAAELAMKEKTTVRIPIPVRTESETFGVYAVPGLQTHVFVGPFSRSSPQTDHHMQSVSKIDGPYEMEIKTNANQELIQISDSEDDDVKEIATNQQSYKPQTPSTSDKQQHSPTPKSEKKETSTSSCSGNNSGKIDATSSKMSVTERFANEAVNKTMEADNVRDEDFKLLKEKILKDKTQRKMAMRNAILAQVPQVIKHNEDDRDIDVIDITEDDENENDKSCQLLSKESTINPLPYVNLDVSTFGRIVYRGDKNPAFDDTNNLEESRQVINSTVPGSAKIINIQIPEYGPLKVLERPKDSQIIFPHPAYDNHEVICSDHSACVQWMKEYLEKYNQSKISDTQVSVNCRNVSTSKNEAKCNNSTRDKIKPASKPFEQKEIGPDSSLVPNTNEGAPIIIPNPLNEMVSSFLRMESNPDILVSQNPDGEFKPGPSSRFLSKTFSNPLPGAPSRKAYALIRTETFNRKDHKDQLKLFNQLHTLIRGTQPRKTTSIKQILVKAKETVEQLAIDQVDLEQTKKALLRKRVTLFETFVQTLNGFPISVKKRALLDTKEMLKKIKEHRGKAVPTDMLPPPSPLPHMQTIKLEGVKSTKDSGPNEEEQTSHHQSNNHSGADVEEKMKYSTDGTAGKTTPGTRLPAPSASKVFGAGAPVVGIPTGLSNISPLKSLSSPTGEIQCNITNPEYLTAFVSSNNDRTGHLGSPSFVTATASSVTPYSDVTGLQTVKKDGKLVRPMNAYMLWSKQYRRELISKGLDGATVSKLLAEEWHKLEEGEKKKFYNQAEYLRKLHQEQHPNYKYSPKARKPRISPRSSRDEKQMPTPITAIPSMIEMERIQTTTHSAMGQPVMTGLPIAEVVHPRNIPGTNVSTFTLPRQGRNPSNTQGIAPESLITVANLTTKYHSAFAGNISPGIDSAKMNVGLSTFSSSPTSINSLPDFQSSIPISQTVSGTTVNPLLMTMPTFDSNAINVAFPPTQHLLQTSSNIPTQTVETAGLMQARSPLTGIPPMNTDSLTIRITNVPTETASQGAVITSAGNRHYTPVGLAVLPISESSHGSIPSSITQITSATNYQLLQEPQLMNQEFQSRESSMTFQGNTSEQQQNRRTINKNKKEIVEISLD